jgi:hypothetical protein
VLVTSVVIAVALIATALTACTASGGHSGQPPSAAEVTAVLARQSRAVLTRDRSVFLGDIDSAAPSAAYRSAQDAAFDNLAELPFARWQYRLGPRVTDAGAQAAARRHFGASALIVSLTLIYALKQVDPVPVSHSLWWTLVRQDGHVVIAADNGLAAVGGVSWKGPWDFGPIAVVRGRSSLVIGEADQVPMLRALATTIDSAVPVVTAVWGRDWTRDVAALVPSSPAALSSALGSDGSGSDQAGPAETSPAGSATDGDTAALAVTGGQDVVSGAPEEQRLVVVPGTFSRLSPLGRRITVTHEITHIASARSTTDTSPRWLVEGLAEYVANLRTGQPVTVAASELRAAVRRGSLPTSLPGAALFASARTAAQAYEQSWLACRLIAQRVGGAGLVRLYRLVGTSSASGGAAVARAFRRVLGESPPQFVTQWRAYLTGQLG